MTGIENELFCRWEIPCLMRKDDIEIPKDDKGNCSNFTLRTKTCLAALVHIRTDSCSTRTSRETMRKKDANQHKPTGSFLSHRFI